MCAIKKFKEEKGFTLINTLIFLMFLGLMGITLVTLVVADIRMQTLNMDEPRAFYAAQSGVEYTLRGIFEQAASHSTLGFLNNYTETLNTGNGTSCTIKILVSSSSNGTDNLQIKATGKSNNVLRAVVKTINVTDVSKYAIYTTGTVSHVSTLPGGKIKQHATTMPFFDYDQLRDMAKPTQYYPHSLTLSSFTFSNNITFVEDDLTFSKFAWLNTGNFVVGKNTLIKHSSALLGWTGGNIFMPFSGADFHSEKQPFLRFLNGGLIVNGDISAVRGHFLWFSWNSLQVIYNRNRMNNYLLNYSLNGGPIVVNSSNWKISH